MPTMQHQGTLTSWNDDRGFGFIQPTAGGEPVFVHIKAFVGTKGRPNLNQRLVFEVQTTAQGKKRAANVQLAAFATGPAKPRQPARKRNAGPAEWGTASRWAIPAMVVLVAVVAMLWTVPWWVPGLYVGMSAVCFMAYAFDKSAARAGRWRTAESTLLALGLAGGWPGAVLAQQVLRHKSAKPAFRSAFWGTVVLNVAGFVGWFTPLASHWVK